jgi:NADPH-dependent ferric siderophore reductase
MTDRSIPLYGTVVETVRLAPRLVRVVLGDPGLDPYVPSDFTDQYVNALFLPCGAPYTPPFDLEEARTLPAEERPLGRRYTIRWWDPERRRLAIDFVVHGDVGRAGRWAANARPGDRLQFIGPHGAYAPSTTADWHLLAGDESALPAIAAALEQIRSGVPVLAFLVVDAPGHEIELDCPGDLRVDWVYRESSPGVDAVVAPIARAVFPAGTPDVFVHGEAAEVRAVRRHLLTERGIARDGTSISPYWRRGMDDEAWREVKREWVAEVARDA